MSKQVKCKGSGRTPCDNPDNCKIPWHYNISKQAKEQSQRNQGMKSLDEAYYADKVKGLRPAANWGDALMFINEQDKEIRRLKVENQQLIDGIFATRTIKKLEDENARLSGALESISKNSCCGQCQEAKLVAEKALAEGKRGDK